MSEKRIRGGMLHGPFVHQPLRPAVLDASVLTSDVIAALRRGRPSSLVAAMKDATIRGFATHRVWAEVPRVLEDRWEETARSFDLEKAWSLWWRSYVPRIVVVCTDGLPMSDAARCLADEDPTDVGLVQLADLLAPVVLLSEDGDLRRTGLAHSDWRAARSALGKMGPVEKMSEAVIFGTVVSGYGVSAAIRRVAPLTRRYPLVGLLAGGGILAWIWSRRAEVKDGARLLQGSLWPPVREALEQHRRSEEVWLGQAPNNAEASDLRAVAVQLARSSEPLTRSQILDATDFRAQDDRNARYRRLHEMLFTYPAFSEQQRGRWALGREGVGLDFFV